MTRNFQAILLALLLFAYSALAGASARSATTAPPEIASAAPAGSSLLTFESSGAQPDADAVAVFETPPDKDGSRYRTFVAFQRKGGKFLPVFSNGKVIGCSRCTQFHDDPFWIDNVKVTPGHIDIDQGDGGETSSETSISFIRRDGVWMVEHAVRSTVKGGRGNAVVENLPLPPSGQAKDFDGKWEVPTFYNTIIVNNRTGKFIFRSGTRTQEGVWDEVKGRCDKSECSVLVQQQDGCISLVQDVSAKSFGAGTPDYRNKAAAPNKAMAACQAAGGEQCKVIRTDCNQGI